MDKFQNKYRIPSARAAWWNYGWPGAYFITICTTGQRHFFGEIIAEKMVLSHIGVLADVFWHDIPIHAKKLELGAYVIMPNHVHGIIVLEPDAGGSGIPVDATVDTAMGTAAGTTAGTAAGTTAGTTG